MLVFPGVGGLTDWPTQKDKTRGSDELRGASRPESRDGPKDGEVLGFMLHE